LSPHSLILYFSSNLVSFILAFFSTKSSQAKRLKIGKKKGKEKMDTPVGALSSSSLVWFCNLYNLVLYIRLSIYPSKKGYEEGECKQ